MQRNFVIIPLHCTKNVQNTRHLTKNIIIADTKFEFGLDENGEVVLGDEMLTPDSFQIFAPITR